MNIRNRFISFFVLTLLIFTGISCNHSLDTNKETVVTIYIDQPFITENSSSRTASVVLPDKIWYEVTATNTEHNELVPGTNQTPGTPYYTVVLPSGSVGLWNFTAIGYDSSIDDNNKKPILKGTNSTTVRSGERYDLNISVNFVNNEGTGKIDLPIDVSETGIEKLTVKYTDFKTEVYERNGGQILIKEDAISAKTYPVTLVFSKSVGGSDITICKIEEVINVRENMTTDTWLKSGLSEYLYEKEVPETAALTEDDVEEGGPYIPVEGERFQPVKADFKITKDYIYKKNNAFCYVSSATTADDNNTGSSIKNLKTVAQAIKRSVALHQEFPADKENDFIIYVNGEVSAGTLPENFDGKNTKITVISKTSTKASITDELKVYNNLNLTVKNMNVNSLTTLSSPVNLEKSFIVKALTYKDSMTGSVISESDIGTKETTASVTIDNSKVTFAEENHTKEIYTKDFLISNSNVTIANSNITGENQSGRFKVSNGSSIEMSKVNLNVPISNIGDSLAETALSIKDSELAGTSITFRKCKSLNTDNKISLLGTNIQTTSDITFSYCGDKTSPFYMQAIAMSSTTGIAYNNCYLDFSENEENDATNLICGTINLDKSTASMSYCDIGTGFIDERVNHPDTTLNIVNGSEVEIKETNLGNEKSTDEPNNLSSFSFEDSSVYIHDIDIYLKGIAPNTAATNNPRIVNSNVDFEYVNVFYTLGKGTIGIDNTSIGSYKTKFVETVNYGNLEVSPSSDVTLDGISPVAGNLYLSEDAVISLTNFTEEYKYQTFNQNLQYYLNIFHSNPVNNLPVILTDDYEEYINKSDFRILTPGIALNRDDTDYVISHKTGELASKYLLYQDVTKTVDYKDVIVREELAKSGDSYTVSYANLKKVDTIFCGHYAGDTMTSPTNKISYMLYDETGSTNFNSFASYNENKGIPILTYLAEEMIEDLENNVPVTVQLKVLADVGTKTTYKTFKIKITN